MRDRLETSFARTLPRWQQKSSRLKRLAIYYAWLDNQIYDHLGYEYNNEFRQSRGTAFAYVKQEERKPSVRLNTPSTAARNVARKLFAGRHAPNLQLPDKPEKIVQINKLLREGKMASEMLGLVFDASVGSGCLTFKIVVPDGQTKPRLVLESKRVNVCFPEFDIAKQLQKLVIAYTVPGHWWKSLGYTKSEDGENIEDNQSYWYIKVLDKSSEFYYEPITGGLWNPVNGESKRLRVIQDGPLAQVNHLLGFVPAQWFINLSGGEWPDGACTFDRGLNNLATYDYTMSQTDLGIKNSVCPITVITGTTIQELDEQGKPIPKTPSRHLQFEAGQKMDGVEQKSGEAYYLESNGNSFGASLDVCRQIKKDMTEQMSSSRKDPDKVTTAMSGKGLELVEEEFIDLVFELRTNYGENGYLELVQKILRAAQKANHPLVKDISEDDIDNLELEWPDMHEVSPQEFQQTVQGLQQGYDAGLISLEQGQNTYKTKVDVAQHGKSPKKPPAKPTGTNQTPTKR
jgi:hypothetical protein